MSTVHMRIDVKRNPDVDVSRHRTAIFLLSWTMPVKIADASARRL